MTRAPLLMALLALSACESYADKALLRAAESVVAPVVDDRLTGDQAAAATRCIVINATDYEVERLARDIGVVAGSSTLATVLAIAARPETQACFAAEGVPGQEIFG